MVIKTHATFGLSLEEAALAQYVRAISAGCPLGVTSSYRDPDLQVRLFHENYTRNYAESAKWDGRKWGTVTYWRRTSMFINGAHTSQRTVSVAVPGTSRHEYGNALDLPGSRRDTSTPRGWMHAHGRRFGWYWPTWAQQSGTYEEWHFEYDPALVDIDTEDEMSYLEWPKEDRIAMLQDVARYVLGAGASSGEALTDKIAARVWAERLADGPSAGRYVSHTREIVLGLTTRLGALEAGDVSAEDIADLTAAIKGLPAAAVTELKNRL